MDKRFEPSSAKKIYSRKGIRVATFLGGPFLGAYMFGHNFRVFGTPEKARKAWLMSLLVFIVVFGFGYVVLSDPRPGHKMPPYLILLIYSGLVSLLVRDYEGEEIERHLNRGGDTYSVLRVIGLIILSAVLTLIIPVGFLFLVIV
ncbi:MAG: hypothetical protein JWO06_777 [Bacteroidota bacterium]|nr:hypothetical protein [Bacteroidota bacterium]